MCLLTVVEETQWEESLREAHLLLGDSRKRGYNLFCYIAK